MESSETDEGEKANWKRTKVLDLKQKMLPCQFQQIDNCLTIYNSNNDDNNNSNKKHIIIEKAIYMK